MWRQSGRTTQNTMSGFFLCLLHDAQVMWCVSFNSDQIWTEFRKMPEKKMRAVSEEGKTTKAYSGNASCRLQWQEVSLGWRVIASSRGRSVHALCLPGVAAVWDQPVCENCHYTGQNSCKLTVCTVSMLTPKSGVIELQHFSIVTFLITQIQWIIIIYFFSAKHKCGK